MHVRRLYDLSGISYTGGKDLRFGRLNTSLANKSKLRYIYQKIVDIIYIGNKPTTVPLDKCLTHYRTVKRF